jgi:hypothetical protein
LYGLELSKKPYRKRHEYKANKNTENKSQSNKNHKNWYLSDEQLQVLPANDEEEKEILLTAKAIQATKAKRKNDLSKITKDQKHKDANSSIMKLVQSQTLQIHRIMVILHSVRHNIDSVQGASKSIRDINSEIKKIHYQVSQIQKRLTKKTQEQRIPSKKKKGTHKTVTKVKCIGLL